MGTHSSSMHAHMHAALTGMHAPIHTCARTPAHARAHPHMRTHTGASRASMCAHGRLAEVSRRYFQNAAPDGFASYALVEEVLRVRAAWQRV